MNDTQRLDEVASAVFVNSEFRVVEFDDRYTPEFYDEASVSRVGGGSWCLVAVWQRKPTALDDLSAYCVCFSTGRISFKVRISDFSQVLDFLAKVAPVFEMSARSFEREMIDDHLTEHGPAEYPRSCVHCRQEALHFAGRSPDELAVRIAPPYKPPL